MTNEGLDASYGDDIGSNVRIRWVDMMTDDAQGIVETHLNLTTGKPCSGYVNLDPAAGHPLWTVESRDPLTLSPSILCRECGHHGWIREDRWASA